VNVEPLGIAGAWLIRGSRHVDDRGWFQEWYRGSSLASETGCEFRPVQANISRSARGVIRGIHYSVAPEGQAKLVTVMHGEVDDYVVNLDPNSPTFGQWVRVSLSAETGDAVLISAHMGHAFQALTDGTVVSYLVSAEFNPRAEKGITPLCPTVGIEWRPDLPALLSDKDRSAPRLEEQRHAGLLPAPGGGPRPEG